MGGDDGCGYSIGGVDGGRSSAGRVDGCGYSVGGVAGCGPPNIRVKWGCGSGPQIELLILVRKMYCGLFRTGRRKWPGWNRG